MSFADKFRYKALELRGRIKRSTGQATGDWRLQAKGRTEEVGGHLMQAGERVKDTFRRRGSRRRQH